MTEARLEVLRLIVQAIETRGFPPSQQELAALSGVTPHAIQERLAGLERDGFIAIERNASRGIRLLKNVAGQPVQLKLVPAES